MGHPRYITRKAKPCNGSRAVRAGWVTGGQLRDKMYGELALRTEKAQEPKVVDHLPLMVFLTVAGELFLRGVEILQKLLEVFPIA